MLTNRGPSITVRLWFQESSFTSINCYWPVSLPQSLIYILSSVSQTLPDIWGSASCSVLSHCPQVFFIYLVTHLSLAETTFLDICQSSSNSLIACFFWVKAGSLTRLTKLLLDISFQSRWSNLGQIYTPTWSNEKNLQTLISSYQATKNSDSEMGNKVNTTMSQLTTLRKFPSCSAQRETSCRQVEFLWIYNICGSMLSGNHSTKTRRGGIKICCIVFLYYIWSSIISVISGLW